ncbi:MAG TPA: nitroreductase [Spongiibacteraceae bacterium]|nr:nitroreductase [Spongiibacteraceae bacterium]
MTLLTHRNSEPKLSKPGPDREALLQILNAAARAPDHGRLRPWRFLLIEGKARYHLGELFVSALRARQPEATAEEIKKNEEAPLRAPIIITVIAHIKDHPKVPKLEQILSAGCAAHGILLAAQALGFGAIWRTGDNCYDAHVNAGLGLEANEEIVGYVYIGSALGVPKPLPEIHVEDFLQVWDSAE